MSTLTYAATDSVTLLRRNLKHLVRYPALTVMILGMPLVFLLLFVYVFGGTMGAGCPEQTRRSTAGCAGWRGGYLQYVTPAILVMTVASVANSTAILVAKDATEGIIDRFRTMPIARSAPLTAHVLAALVQTALGVVVVLALAVLLGYRGSPSPASWLGAAVTVLLMGWAMTWLAVGLGLASGSVEAASNAPLPVDPAALPVQRVRADRLDARRARMVRRAPAVHADDRHPARLPRGPRPRCRPAVDGRLVHRDQCGVLLVGRSALRAGSGRLIPCSPSASSRRTRG